MRRLCKPPAPCQSDVPVNVRRCRKGSPPVTTGIACCGWKVDTRTRFVEARDRCAKSGHCAAKIFSNSAEWQKRYGFGVYIDGSIDGSRRRNRGAPSTSIRGARLDERRSSILLRRAVNCRLSAVGPPFIIAEGAGMGDPRSRAETWSISVYTG